MIRILRSAEMHQAAHAFTDALHRTLCQEHHDRAVGGVLTLGQEECFKTAQIELEQLERAGWHA